MKRLLVVGLALIMNGSSAFGGARDAQWKQVDEAVNKGLPQTAIDALEPIIQQALKEQAYGEATKAIARKFVLEGSIQGNKPEERIVRLEAEIAKAPRPMGPLLETILAHWYWHYFQENRWRFLQRTATAQSPGKDFTTWDLARLLAEIDRRFQIALASADVLKKIPVGAYDALLPKGSFPDSYRPTLYDFIAYEALEFYSSGEQAGAKPEDAFEASAEGPIFDSAEAFVAWKLDASASESATGKALALFQQLLSFHRNDAERSAFIDADLARLVYGNNVVFGDTKAARYQAALKALAERSAGHELSALVFRRWAFSVKEQGDLVEARRIAQKGVAAFSSSAGGKLCQNLIAEIEAKSSEVSTERIWNCAAGMELGRDGPGNRREACSTIVVRYRNVTNVYFRAVAYNWEIFLERSHSRPERLNDRERKQVLAKAPSLEWSAPLPPATDFKERAEILPAPGLKPGFYFIIASHDPAFREVDNKITLTDVLVSDLALVTRPRNGNIEGFVLEAESGEPLNGAEVQAWRLDNQGNRVPSPPLATDENGFFSFPSQVKRGYLLRVRHHGAELGSRYDLSSSAREPVRVSDQTVFFTDRGIYRPGQTIQYKGICVHVDSERDNYEVLQGRDLTVVFSDPNNKEIARQRHRCNDYGSFSGSFTAPRDRLMGSMRIHVNKGPDGEARFNVEEYKRLKFQVSLDAPKAASKLNERASLQGRATSYTGAPIDGAQVSFRVTRETRYAHWSPWYSRRSPYGSDFQEMTHGVVRTESDGSFQIEFRARPNTSIPEKEEPIFSYHVYANVTDGSGETAFAQRNVNAGYTALQAVLSADEWQTGDRPVEIKMRTASSDGVGQPAAGSLTIYALREPAQVQRPPHTLSLGRGEPPAEEAQDMSHPHSWQLGEVVAQKDFATDTSGDAQISFNLPSGAYRVTLQTQDGFGKKVTTRLDLHVLKPDATKLAVKIPHLLAAPEWTAQPGKEFMALWGTGYENGRACVEVEYRNKLVERYWTKPGQTQQQLRCRVTEAMRGGFTLHVTQVRANRAYLDSRHIEVPWSNKNLDLKWEHFTSKLEPGQKDTWTAVVSGPNAEKTVAEMAAVLYDQSLNAFRSTYWLPRFDFFHQDFTTAEAEFENVFNSFTWIKSDWADRSLRVDMSYRSFPYFLAGRQWGYGGLPAAMSSPPTAVAPINRVTAGLRLDGESYEAYGRGGASFISQEQPDRGVLKAKATIKPDLSQVTARKNLNETAFFFPHLLSDENGIVKMEFTMPEALTQWKFLGFAHDKQLRSGFLETSIVTAKDLMVQPNPPRFVREGDVLEFTVKVSNQTVARQTGKVRLTFNDAASNQAADAALGNSRPDISFDIPAKESKSYFWKIKVPDGIGFLTYKAVGSTGRVSDGEEGFLPVLSRFVFLTESMPLPIRGPGTKSFAFSKLENSGKSSTLRHQGLTVQMVSNPSWYAILALPYLMEFPHECSEQVFNRLYANALARTIAADDPKVRRVFDEWKNTPALDSPLEKNQDLKGVMIEETPWLHAAQSESEARRNVGVLFDANRLNYELGATLRKLAEMQLPDGSWPWFPGGHGNEYITLYVTTGSGRLRHLGVDIDIKSAMRSLGYLDAWIDEHYREIVKQGHKAENHLSETIALYLYGRSFFLKDMPVGKQSQEAVEYFLGQARSYWLKLASRQSQGHLALALQRFGDKTAAQGIMKSIRERAVTNEEMGMFWRDTEFSVSWYRAPIETQALMIEAFDEVAGDASAVEACKAWLLKQKQTQDWKTTKATADAIYALLLRGRDNLASDALVEIALGGKVIKAEQVEAGTGFYEKKFGHSEIQPQLGRITVRKSDPGVAWGSVHWQYLEDLRKVSPYEGTPLKLNKTLYLRANTKKGPVLEPVKGPLHAGDEVVVRLNLRVDRDLEFVHLKDQRGSGTEPVNVLSSYKYQDGLGYYELTRDTATHFFIDYLPKGNYVFDYLTRIVHKGEYRTGIAEIQCMYAPEFNSHSESLALTVEGR